MTTEKLGLPCWQKENIANAISVVAQVDSSYVDYFLASHTPIEGIVNDKTKESYTEESLFNELSKNSHGQVLAVIHGDPGTGKSHLIHWLKLRCEDALNREELQNIVPVLVQRRSGSLKDALEQIVNQLPAGFDKYLSGIKSAIGQISDTTARLKLAQSLFLELQQDQREQRNQPVLPTEIKSLPEVFNSAGFRNWLCRLDGTIDRNIRRLSEGSKSETREKEAFPSFDSNEFNPDITYRGKDTPAVRDLTDELDFESDLREVAAAATNEALPSALRSMTGLSNAGLRDIFDNIRKDLKAQGKELYLFIEDISVMSALDDEVFIAVEPQPRSELCRMVAVLGLTEQGWRKLVDNQYQRITHPLGVAQATIGGWATNPKKISEFAARYLNTVRLDPGSVAKLANNRRQGGDFISDCELCPVKDDCHQRFGSVLIDKQEIGLFPFNHTAIPKMLTYLDPQANTRKNQRGLLTDIIKPVLDQAFDQLPDRKFPSLSIAVKMPEPEFWSTFENQYCGGWTDAEKKRMRRLIQGWTATSSFQDAASSVAPCLSSLGFPAFSKDTAPAKQPVNLVITQAPIIDEPPKHSVNEGVVKSVTNLRDWIDGKELVGDSEIRDLLSKLVKNSVSWDDEQTPPLEVWQKLVSDTGTKPYRIEGQRSNPVGVNFRFDFERTEDNRALFESLVKFKAAGSSWDFENAELPKRKIFEWLRQNARKTIAAPQPKDGLNEELPVRRAAQTLAFAAIVRKRAALQTEPQDYGQLINDLLTPFTHGGATCFSDEMKKLLVDLGKRHQQIREFLISELDSPQSREARGFVFIDPLPIISAVRNFGRELKIYELSEDYFQGHYRSRYEYVKLPADYNKITALIQKENASLKDYVETLLADLRSFGIETDDPYTAVIRFCEEVPLLVSATKNSSVVVNYPLINELIQPKNFSQRKEVWANALKRAVDFNPGTDLLKVLAFDPTALVELGQAVKTVDGYIRNVEREVNRILATIEIEGDPDRLQDQLISKLDSISQTIDESGIIKEA